MHRSITNETRYYSGEKRAPILTLFIGGNHEASNYLQELPYGGWVAPNIYYLGRAGIVNFGGLRIGGLSGIFKGRDYLQGLWECPPYSQESMRSVYHVRSLDVFRLSQVKGKVHVMLSHDWPRGITNHGDVESLLKRKPFFREDIESNQLGSVPAATLLHQLKPDYWFAAHLHCQFAAIVQHDNGADTKFLALDKCLPKRKHLQILDIPAMYDGDKCLKYDPEWLMILKKTNHLLTVKNMNCHMPGPGGNEEYIFTPTKEEKESVIKIMENMTIHESAFEKTAPVYNPNIKKGKQSEPIMNPQTIKLCDTLGIDDPVQVVMARTGRIMKEPCGNDLRKDTKETEVPEEPSAPNPIPVPITPIKTTKLSLPAPITPSENEMETNPVKEFTVDNFSTPDNTLNSSDCMTPMSSGEKKTFKRRNISIYNSPDDDLESGMSNSFNVSGSPCKLPHRDNV
ncbi:lariat debranching enzyme isoform X2 [Manduca sexta]|uniref:Lariat debranching enzyme C-terminal domain-containing protein n=1 Tax=Manduca sexta TaxID=7130 RepID=A0A921YS21_MANSE|nr:lariat debranching enzyme isoform X2 [Manduca sexta]KAG6444826.1 hypothetical protein O3G_MSEX003525 [Manduca sexta]